MRGTEYRYLHLDVFADQVFHGNQLAVFPEAEGLDAHQMQRIAGEMAFSETTFVFGATADADHRVRIFTPSRELPMAGHPTIGTAFALAHERRIAADAPVVTMALGVGPTPVSLEWSEGSLSFAWMPQPAPEFGMTTDHRSALAAGLGLAAQDLQGTKLPVQEVSSGVPFLFVPLARRAAVDAARMDRGAIQRFFTAIGMTERPLFVFTDERGNDDATAYARMFAPLFGIPEDPATGGACGPLGGYLLYHGAISAAEARRLTVLQGVAMGRPSRIVVSVETDNGRLSGIRVGGTSVLAGAGVLLV